jgi:hypothetical protein
MVFSTEYARFAQGLGPEWRKVAEAPEGVAYHREPRRFVPVKVLTFLFDRPGVTLMHPEIRITAERRNSVTVQVTPAPTVADEDSNAPHRPAVAPIAFVRPFLPGYKAFLNGAPIPVRPYRGILPIVELPPDAGGVLELRYRPRGLTSGLILTAASASAMLLILVVGRRRRAGLPRGPAEASVSASSSSA